MDFLKQIFERVAGKHGRKSTLDGVVIAIAMLLLGFGEHLSATHAKELSWGGLLLVGGSVLVKIFKFDPPAIEK